MVYEQIDLYDDLPEEHTYLDKGCRLAPSCLNCPFPYCAYDLPGGERRLLKEGRNQEIVRLSASGLTVKQIAAEYGVSPRTVQRVLKKARENNGRTGGNHNGRKPNQ